LSEKVDSSAIEEANKEVTGIVENTGGKWKPYVKLTPEQKAACTENMKAQLPSKDTECK